MRRDRGGVQAVNPQQPGQRGVGDHRQADAQRQRRRNRLHRGGKRRLRELHPAMETDTDEQVDRQGARQIRRKLEIRAADLRDYPQGEEQQWRNQQSGERHDWRFEEDWRAS